MSELECKETGKASMMRKLSWILVVAGVAMYAIELVFCMVMYKYGIDYDIHETINLGVIGMGITGKAVQKQIEKQKQ